MKKFLFLTVVTFFCASVLLASDNEILQNEINEFINNTKPSKQSKKNKDKSGKMKYFLQQELIKRQAGLTKSDVVGNITFKRKKIGIIDSNKGPLYTYLLETILLKDRRFEFIDRKLAAKILKRILKKQTGLTNSDDSDNMLMRNIHFLIALDDVKVRSYITTRRKYKTEYYYVNGKKKSKKVWYQVYYYKTAISGKLKIIKVEEGREMIFHNVLAYGASSDSNSSSFLGEDDEKSSFEGALYNLEKKVLKKLKILFPVEAPLYAVKYRKLKLGRGSNSGVKVGQRYVLKEKKNSYNNKSSKKKEVGFIQVTKTFKNHSEAHIYFMSDKILQENTTAKEEHFENISIEAVFSLREFQNTSPGAFQPGGGLKIWFGLFHNIVECGLGFVAGSYFGTAHYTGELNLRGNIPIIRRFALLLNLGFSIEFTDSQHYTFYGGIGVNFTTTKRIYMFINADYVKTIVKYFDSGPKLSNNLDGFRINIGTGYRF